MPQATRHQAVPGQVFSINSSEQLPHHSTTMHHHLFIYFQKKCAIMHEYVLVYLYRRRSCNALSLVSSSPHYNNLSTIAVIRTMIPCPLPPSGKSPSCPARGARPVPKLSRRTEGQFGKKPQKITAPSSARANHGATAGRHCRLRGAVNNLG